MFVMMVSDVHFEQLWNKLAPEGRHLVSGLPCRAVLIPPLNVLVLTSDTLVADDPDVEEINMIAIRKQLKVAKVVSRINP